MGNPFWLTDDFHKQAAISDIGAKTSINQMQVCVYLTNGRGTNSFDMRMLLQNQKHLEQSIGIVGENTRVDGFQISIMGLEAAVYRFNVPWLVCQNNILFKQL